MSGDLVSAGVTLLENALHDRRRDYYRFAATHYTPHAMPAIVLVYTAFDAFVTEAYGYSITQLPWALEFAAKAPLLPAPDGRPGRYDGLFRASGLAPTATILSELELLADVRNEVSHPLVRAVPAWLMTLEARGLLMAAPHITSWGLVEKLSSYALAYWAFETVEAAVTALVGATPGARCMSVALAPNFSSYHDRAAAPALLGDFDSAFALSLT